MSPKNSVNQVRVGSSYLFNNGLGTADKHFNIPSALRDLLHNTEVEVMEKHPDGKPFVKIVEGKDNWFPVAWLQDIAHKSECKCNVWLYGCNCGVFLKEKGS